MDLPRTVSLMIFAYMLGSIPFSYLVARAWGVDLRTVGSGNIGAANVWRSCGPLAAILALAGDLLKGTLPTLAAAGLGMPEFFITLVGAAAIIGHVRPIFLGFRGGKAVATSGGVLLVLAPLLVLVGVVAWGVGFGLTRTSAVGSLVAAAAVPIAATLAFANGIVGAATLAFCWVLALAVVYLHRGNIARLRDGSEPRFR